MRGREDEAGHGVFGAAELEPVPSPDREVGPLARLERADVIAASTAAPPRVPSASASLAVSAAGPPRPRATRSACLTSARRSPRSFDAEPSTPRPTRTPASRYSRTGATPAPSRRFDVGQCATPVPDARNRRCRRRRDGRSARTRRFAEPAEVREVLDRRRAVELHAVRLLLDRLREVRVQREPCLRASSADSSSAASSPRTASTVRPRSGPSPLARPRAAVDEPLGVRERGVDVLDELVGREAAVGDAQVHRAARRDDPQTELPRSLLPPPRRGPSVRAGRRSGGRRRSSSPTARARRGRCAQPRTPPLHRSPPRRDRAREAS